MHITADSCLFPAHNQCDLAVCLKAYQTINYMTSCLLQLLRPYNIILFIKTGFQFYQYGNLFAVFCCLRKGSNDR